MIEFPEAISALDVMAVSLALVMLALFLFNEAQKPCIIPPREAPTSLDLDRYYRVQKLRAATLDEPRLRDLQLACDRYLLEPTRYNWQMVEAQAAWSRNFS